MSWRSSNLQVRRLTRVAALAGVVALIAVWATRDAPRPHRASKPAPAVAVPEVVTPPLEGPHREMAVRTSRRFLAVYMRAIAGRPLRGDEGRLTEVATPQVAAQVAPMAQDPADMAGLRARTGGIVLDGTARRAEATTTIYSGGTTVTLNLALDQRAGRWQITEASIDAAEDDTR